MKYYLAVYIDVHIIIIIILLKYYKTLLAYNLMLIYDMPNEMSLEYLKSL